ncbi:hypothetical protein SCUCBS95973_009893 [Sporothrix curviconia]|uniref:Small secreted protein n=1 Tax=Sporothrix curviconia TaxID=1260050 RepID=A0ABP0D1G6_9PEZI
MKVAQLSSLVVCALLGASPVDAAAAKCRLATPPSSVSAGPSSPECYTNYITNKYFAGAAGWTFSGDSAPSTSCGLYSTCAQLNADAGTAPVSQTLATVPGFSYYASFAYIPPVA